MLRLFVGIDLPSSARESLSLLAAGLPGARWLAPETYHVTLAFIGDLDEGAAEELHEELSTVRGKDFLLELSGVGSFESKGKLRALWAGVVLSEPLAILQGRVAAACVRAGVKIEKRKFKPHVTLARFSEQPSKAKLGDWLAAHSLMRLQPLAVTSFVLFQSHLGREGAHYEALERYALEA
ncbi:MAG: RNA 2',3'-cyclic phosphodiesterase [Rhodospirillales bacterium]|nr:RNA 2',3'-cyclic phosphodiesterase [Rhodospirillales bacterium]